MGWALFCRGDPCACACIAAVFISELEARGAALRESDLLIRSHRRSAAISSPSAARTRRTCYARLVRGRWSPMCAATGCAWASARISAEDDAVKAGEAAAVLLRD